MTSPAMTGIELCVFDAYGTLYDFNSAVARHRDEIGPKADALSETWRRKQIEYTWLRNSMGEHASFFLVTSEALDYSLKALGIPDENHWTHDGLLGAHFALDPFPEAPSMLDRLRGAGIRCAILSNGDQRILDLLVEWSRLAEYFEAVLSVDAAGVFKVDPRAYALVEVRCGVKPANVCFVSSNCWDAHGAARFGFNTVWVNRAGAPDDNLPGTIAAQIKDLSALPSLLGVS